MQENPPQAARPDLVVVGGSAGGVDALKRFVRALPKDLPATVCVALHLGSGTPSLLPGILARDAVIRVEPAVDGTPLEAGVVHVAQADTHLAVVGDHLVVGRGPRENGNRPSIDVLLRSAAVARGPRAVGVVLTGMLDDGTAGLAALARYGGLPLVQDPDDAEFPSMPRNAFGGTPSALALPLDALVDEVVRIVTTDQPGTRAEDAVDAAQRDVDEAEVRSALGLDPSLPDGSPLGVPSPYGCPDCGGVLNEVVGGTPVRFRCRVGHAYSAESLLRHQAGTFEDALWTALRAVEEREDVSRRLAAEAFRSGRDWSRVHFTRRAEDARRSAQVLRKVLADHRTGLDAEPDAAGAAAP